jgi:hypothetical protein
MIPTLFNMMFPVLLIQLAYLVGFIGSAHILTKERSGKPYCLWYYTFGYSVFPFGLGVLAFLNVLGVF